MNERTQYRVLSHFGGAEWLQVHHPEIESEVGDVLVRIEQRNAARALTAELRELGYRRLSLNGVAARFTKGGVLVNIMPRFSMNRLVRDLAIVQHFYASEEIHAGIEIILDASDAGRIEAIRKVLKNLSAIPAKIVARLPGACAANSR